MKIISARVMSESPLIYRNEETKSQGKAIVIYDTLFGNTEKVAEALAKGIKNHGVEVKCINIKDASIDDLEQYNLVAVGAPTHYLKTSKPMKDFLSQLEGASRNFAGKYGFAFDTRYDSFMAGSAAKYIEKKLDKIGLEMIRPRTSAIVRGTKEKGKGCDTTLREGEETVFEAVGNEIGTILVAKTITV
jgi:flavorubredoxin